jgi:hypothetical protein
MRVSGNAVAARSSGSSNELHLSKQRALKGRGFSRANFDAIISAALADEGLFAASKPSLSG